MNFRSEKHFLECITTCKKNSRIIQIEKDIRNKKSDWFNAEIFLHLQLND